MPVSLLSLRREPWPPRVELGLDREPCSWYQRTVRSTASVRSLAGVPEIAVQQMLDHNSPQMTSVYARLHDQTLREHFDRF